MKLTRFQDIPQFTQSGSYAVDVGWNYLEKHLEDWTRRDGTAPVDLDPDFQRAHVWTREQQVAYVEYCLRGGRSGRDLYFNCVGWMRDYRGPFVLVDGKQRLTAVRSFLADEFEAFGSKHSEYTDSMRVHIMTFRFHVNDLKTRAQVLNWYLEMNAGGTPHTDEEIGRVSALLAKEIGK